MNRGDAEGAEKRQMRDAINKGKTEDAESTERSPIPRVTILRTPPPRHDALRRDENYRTRTIERKALRAVIVFALAL